MKKHITLFSGGIIFPGKIISTILKSTDQVIAADDGASNALACGVIPEMVIGDFDSINKKTLSILKKRKVLLQTFPQEKDFTDTELALEYAKKLQPREIVIIAGTEKGRIDHVMANILLLSKISCPAMLTNGQQTIYVKNGPNESELLGKKNDLLSLIPLSEKVMGITTVGLKYPLKNETLTLGSARGVSNEFLNKKIKIKWRSGMLSLIHSTKF